MSQDEKVVYIVHCIDAEGPLYESLDAKFERLRDLYGVELDPTRANFEKLTRKELDLGGLEEVIAQTFSGHLMDYKDTWDKIDDMLSNVMGEAFRKKMVDSNGDGWIFNWFCLDHVDYLQNPRRRDIGYHNIYDHYRAMIAETNSTEDGVHWHFHPMSAYRDAHRCATSYVNSPHLHETLCRRIIERNWFPSVYRAGFQAERPDSHLFLEQWIPFDITNMSVQDPNLEVQLDFANGRSADWRLAPDDWSIYHPSHDHYQIPGNCRRWIARALNTLNRLCNLTQGEVDKAFSRANEGLPTLMGIAAHDFRELSREVDEVRRMVAESVKKYPDVRFEFAEAKEAFQKVAYGKNFTNETVELDCALERGNGSMLLTVNTKAGQVFGPQPFLAIKMKSNRYVHDNFDFDVSLKKWFYTFDAESILPDDVEVLGIAANDQFGNTHVQVVKVDE